MGFWDYIRSKVGTVQPSVTSDGRTGSYSQFGSDIYASEIVVQCVRCIANEMRKLAPRHVIELADSLQVQSGDIADVLARPNELMTTADFLEKVTWQLFRKSNAFIYPTFIETPTGRKYTGLYPLNPSGVTFGDVDGVPSVELTFNNGIKTVLPYADLIHIRLNFSLDDFMGGGADGLPDNASLLETLKLTKSVRDGMKKAANGPVNGVVRYGTLMSEGKLSEEVAKFDKRLRNNESGLLALDAKSEYQQIASGAKIVDKDTMDFLKKEVGGHFGVSLPILEGTATIDQKRAFYDSAIEPLVTSLNQAFTDCMVSAGRRYRGHRIVFYYGELLFMTYEQKIEFVKEVGGRGVLTDNQILGIFGMPPYDGGDVRRVSLNYVDSSIANEYQMSNAGAGQQDQGAAVAPQGGTENGESQ